MYPKVLIMDEPTAGLDPEMVHRLYEIADEVNVNGSTVMISTHDVETAYSWADLVIVIVNGEVLAHGTPFEVFSMRDVIEKAGLSVPMVHEVNEFISLNTGRNIYGRTMSTVLLNMRRKCAPGTLYVMRPGYNGEMHGRIGMYGSSSRSFADKNKIDVQLKFNAIERCVEEVLNGNHSSLYLDASLDHVLNRKLLDVAAHGIIIPVEELQ
jgi:cobalt/nickel transport system ATP-binding protein